MQRDDLLHKLERHPDTWDFIVIGGGATGLGVAIEASSRGYATLLLEQSDFAKGTSSRSTKLVHGGVRYLRQGNLSLVLEALKERGLLYQNAPHLVRNLPFVVPTYDWWEGPFYGVGLKLYDTMAGRQGFGHSRRLTREETREMIPTIEMEGLRGGIVYHDGQFDDARLAVHMAWTAVEQGAVPLNYMRVSGLRKSNGTVRGVTAIEAESGKSYNIEGRVVVNATGPFSDGVRLMDDPQSARMIRPSQGVHIVLKRSFLPGSSAVMVPHTADGRVLFAIPWHDRVVVGTTDTMIDEASLEPTPLPEEVDFILEHAARYLTKDPQRSDILSAYAGVRPLVSLDGDQGTASISRDHTISISRSGLVTVAGGKWTTYRRMAEDTVDQAVILAELPEKESVSRHLHIHGYHAEPSKLGDLSVYGTDAEAIRGLVAENPRLGETLHPEMPVLRAEVVWAARSEMARTVEDVLARRTRSLLLDAKASVAMAPEVAELLARELGRDLSWRTRQVEEYAALAQRYLPR